MKVINLFGGPGSGKSTTAAALFHWLKLKHKRAELVGEAAKELIYIGRTIHQPLVVGMQHAKLVELAKAGCEYAISDSALAMQAAYCKSETLKRLCFELFDEFDNYNVYIERGEKPYDTFGRWQKDIEIAKKWDDHCDVLGKYDLVAKDEKAIIEDSANWLK